MRRTPCRLHAARRGGKIGAREICCVYLLLTKSLDTLGTILYPEIHLGTVCTAKGREHAVPLG